MAGAAAAVTGLSEMAIRSKAPGEALLFDLV
jgi:hypothetical protein